MVLSLSMKIFAKYIFPIIILMLLSCDEQGWFVRCLDCFPDEPRDATLLINFDDYRYMKAPPLIKIYKGNIEDSLLITSFAQSTGTSTYDVSLNVKYTLTAKYIMDSGKTYIVVDAVTPKVKYEKTLCEKPCYFVYDKIVNLKLKYD
jgi:hypothetical protein